ncbi:MarR family winged helix-turn-helix transcriptional regulator [Dickeya dianthicola]|uniref:MarR family winged helix-turn-helix transcriptional regulator n=1 Tax=Dickeya dianthicola TaxID=204039 RepID=UPI001BDF3815|nr:MarR family transcriptional regulator [Dickeya dianthicola]MBT1426158.1 MarR family transcriptional regulator [Dickeya dianthicola]MBT1430210.1 MarR family transcriptional regulator [Dickeya dianthicola]MBT1457678.1 MarR family transcriptional regulator [Dickeya dianthicola]MBT1486820.1 MarR family transcriptional regulator [Dickeya dianthicola]
MRDTLDNQTFELLGELIHSIKQRMQESDALTQTGLAPFQARTLGLIARHPGQSQHFLAQCMGRDKAQIARLLKDLEALGLITRQPSPTDRRAQVVSLTKKGEDTHRRFADARTGLLQRAFADVTPEERRQFVQVLQKMKANLTTSES